MSPTVRVCRNVRAHAVAAARPVAVWEALGSARGPAAVQSVIDGLEGCDHAQLVSKLRDLQALAGLDPLAPVADPEPWKNSLKMLATTPDDWRPIGAHRGRGSRRVGAAGRTRPAIRWDLPGVAGGRAHCGAGPGYKPGAGRTGRAGTARLCAGRFVVAPGRGRDLGDGHRPAGAPFAPLRRRWASQHDAGPRSTTRFAPVRGGGVDGATRPAVRCHADCTDAP